MAAEAADRYRRPLGLVHESIGKAQTLLDDGHADEAEDVLKDAQKKLTRVPKKWQEDLPSALDTLLARTKPPVRQTPADVIPDYESVVAEYAGLVIQGIDGLLSTADAATELAHHMLSGYEQFRHEGAPDFMANSQNARDFASAVRAETERRFREGNTDQAWEDVQLLVSRVWRVYKSRVGDLRAQISLGLDDKPREFKRRFPQAAEQYPDLKPSEAMSFYYRVDLLGPSERDRRAKRIRNMSHRISALPAGPERDSLIAEQRELQDSLGKPSVPAQSPSLVKTTRSAVRQIGDAVMRVDPREARNLPDSEKRILAQALPSSIKRLTDLLEAVADE